MSRARSRKDEATAPAVCGRVYRLAELAEGDGVAKCNIHDAARGNRIGET